MSNIAETTGRIHSDESFGALDGPGIRYVVFLQGCLLRCAYCHNPDTWDCGDGTSTKAGEVVEKILPFRNFIRSGGVTLSGGEPLMQPEFGSGDSPALQRTGIPYGSGYQRCGAYGKMPGSLGIGRFVIAGYQSAGPGGLSGTDRDG